LLNLFLAKGFAQEGSIMSLTKEAFCSVFLMIFVFTSLVFAADMDGDGLSDDLELQVGSSPAHKDIFVHIDWLVVNGRSMRPRGNFNQIVTAVFASAPINNPDGTTGIRLHISMGRGIPTSREAMGFEESGGYNWEEFDSIKFTNFPFSRRQTHHYCLFAKDLGDGAGIASGISGRSRNNLSAFKAGASDFIVALGGPGWWNYPTASEYKWTQVGTFLHELGHNLGLMHGGTDHISFKPNHLSVMSYAFQALGIPITMEGDKYYLYDYSRLAPAPINERSVCDFRGLGNLSQVKVGDIEYGTRWWIGLGNEDYLEDFFAWFVDWNNDGETSLCDKSYVQHLNPLFDDKLTNLKGGVPEWNRLVYTGGQVGSAQTKLLPINTQLTCMRSTEKPKVKIQSNKNVSKVTYTDVILKSKKN
jgi:hypothetical protein